MSWLGQEANEDKSNIFFSSVTRMFDRREVTRILGLDDIGSNPVYLGNSLIFGGNKSKKFDHLKDRVRVKLEGWPSLLLCEQARLHLSNSFPMLFQLMQ